MSNPKKNLIIGANSFLGRKLIELLLKKGDQVLGVYHKNTENLIDSVANYQFSELFNLKNDFDYVFLISAYVPQEGDKNIEEKLNQVNVELVRKVSKYFASSKLIYASTVSVYQSSKYIISENSPTDPNTLYGKSKLEAEKIVQCHDRYSIIRISSMYGKRMKKITFLPLVIKNAVENKKIVIYGKGKRKQNYIHVKDVSRYMINSINVKNGVYLAVSKKSYSNSMIAKIIQSLIGDVKIVFEGQDFSKSFEFDNTYTRKELDIDSEADLKESLKKIIDDK